MSFPTPQVADRRSTLSSSISSRTSSSGDFSQTSPPTPTPTIVAKVSISKALPQPGRDQTASPRSSGYNYQENEEVTKLKKELEEERKKSANLEANLANATKTIKQLEAQLAKEKSELEFLKNKITTALVKKESSPKLEPKLNSQTSTPSTPKINNPPLQETKSIDKLSNVGTKVREPMGINNARTVTQDKKEIKTNTYRDPRLTQSITKVNNIMTKIIVDVLGGEFDVASARTFDSIIDEITDLCEPEFTKMKNKEEKNAMFQMLDDLYDTSTSFIKVAMNLRSDADNEELLTKLDNKTKQLEELLDDLGGVLFEKPDVSLERMSRLSRINPQPAVKQQQDAPLQKSRSRVIQRSTNSPLNSNPTSQSSSPTGSGTFNLPSLPSLPQPEGTRVRATEFSCPTLNDTKQADENLLARQSKKVARASVRLMTAERQSLPPTEERRQSKIIRKSITSRTPELENARRAHSKSAITPGSIDVALNMASGHTNSIYSTGKRQPLGGPRQSKRQSALIENLPLDLSKMIAEESNNLSKLPVAEQNVVKRRSSILQLASNAGLLSNKPVTQARHALVKPSTPAKVSFENEYSSDSESDDMDDDDEDLIAQREEFAALFGKSLKDLVKEKQDKQVWMQLELVGSLVNKCAIASQAGTHVSKFLCSSIMKESTSLVTLLRTLGEGNITYYDLAEDIEDQAEEYTELSKKLYKQHLTKSKINDAPLVESQQVFHKLLKSIAEFKQNEPKATTVMRGKIS